MRELTFSNYFPAKLTPHDLNKILLDLLRDSSEIVIASGYISNDAIVELNRIVEDNIDKVQKLSIFIGMHYIEGFTKQQYDSCLKLNTTLVNRGIGGVYISPNMKFHGKLYSFVSSDNKITSLIGSANLSSFLQSIERTYETMLLLENDITARDIYHKSIQLLDKLGLRIDEASPLSEEDFIKSKPDLSGFDEVEILSDNELQRLLAQRSKSSFNIPIKSTDKSNLNTFFGKGRENKRGFVVPRPWYEVELIVPRSITSQASYPKGDFKVVTDDGWVFECRSQGDYSKNLRSKHSLSILGKWIKGRLESSGCLETGNKVDDEVLQCYGKKHIVLRSTDESNLWIMEF